MIYIYQIETVVLSVIETLQGNRFCVINILKISWKFVDITVVWRTILNLRVSVQPGDSRQLVLGGIIIFFKDANDVAIDRLGT